MICSTLRTEVLDAGTHRHTPLGESAPINGAGGSGSRCERGRRTKSIRLISSKHLVLSSDFPSGETN